jgi:hypothetical protein
LRRKQGGDVRRVSEEGQHAFIAEAVVHDHPPHIRVLGGERAERSISLRLPNVELSDFFLRICKGQEKHGRSSQPFFLPLTNPQKKFGQFHVRKALRILTLCPLAAEYPDVWRVVMHDGLCDEGMLALL